MPHDQFICERACLYGIGEIMPLTLGLEETRERVRFIRFMDEIITLLRRGKGQSPSFDVDMLRITHEAIGKGTDAGRHGRGK
jgi:hypothetical protein